MSCPNLATKSDISALEGRILEALSGLATKDDISRIESAIESFNSTINSKFDSINDRLGGIESILADHSAALARIEAALDGVSGTVQGFWGALADIFESLVSLIRDPIVSALEAQRALIDGLFDSLEAFIVGLFDGVKAAITGAFDALSTLIREFFGGVQATLGGIDGNLDNVLSMLGDLSWDVRRALTELNQIDSALSTIQSGINDLGAGQDSLNARIVEIRDGLGVIDGRLANLADVVAAINNRTSDIYSRQGELLNRVGDVLGAIASVNSALDALESEVREIYGSINALQGEVNAIPGEVWGYALCSSSISAGALLCRIYGGSDGSDGDNGSDSSDSEDDLNKLDTRELLEAIAKVTGVPDFPGKLPKTLLGDDDLKGETEVKSIPQFILWLTKQLDALVGEFPLEIEVKSSEPDPKTPGGYIEVKETVKLRNIAETMGELYTQGFYLTTMQHAQTNALVRTGNELMSLKVAVLVAQDLIMAANEFLGFRMKRKERKTNFSFTPKTSDKEKFTLVDFLENYEGKYQGWDFDDQEILIEYLPQLLYGVSLVKAATLRGQDDIDQLQDQVEEVLKDGDTAWDRFRDLVNNPDSEYNLGEGVKFRIEDRNVEDEK
ncbi:hypothetical protein AWQ21_09635 [Picosynechococcus sp. PCC 7003]|uniref:phage tail protein n=1 Tax=Picosynechococcus sp. PCC 7003 TaxID=374981 RepID=UPI000810C50B|nr:hypothetical protein [Picosynechococcus sp. PCC 7003]ANV84623.1 hypothetical protein AWQ21_09635 [Picosynechococcus sp. PCC 7003]